MIAVVAAIYGGSRPAAIAVAAMGGLALLIFLISDLRVANATGQLSEGCGSASCSAPRRSRRAASTSSWSARWR